MKYTDVTPQTRVIFDSPAPRLCIGTIKEIHDDTYRQFLKQAFVKCGCNKSLLARCLNLSRTTLTSYFKKYKVLDR